MCEKLRAFYFLAVAEAARGSNSSFVNLWNVAPVLCQPVDENGVPFDAPNPCGTIDIYLHHPNDCAEQALKHWGEALGFDLMTFEELSQGNLLWIQLPSGKHWLNGPKQGTLELNGE